MLEHKIINSRDEDLSIPNDKVVFFIKLVGIGPRHLKENQGELLDLAESQPGFFLVFDEIEQASEYLTKTVQKAVKAYEQQQN